MFSLYKWLKYFRAVRKQLELDVMNKQFNSDSYMEQIFEQQQELGKIQAEVDKTMAEWRKDHPEPEPPNQETRDKLRALNDKKDLIRKDIENGERMKRQADDRYRDALERYLDGKRMIKKMRRLEIRRRLPLKFWR